MRKILQRGRFRADFARLEKRGKDFSKLDAVVTTLAEVGRLDPSKRPHKLKGKYARFWECHIESDWLLIYKLTDKELILARTGTHADLFK